MSIRAQDLRKTKGDMEAQQRSLYDNIISECFHRIQRVHSESNAEWTFYCVPLALSGEPMYDWRGCVQHLKTSLTENGFKVKLHKDRHTLFISWDEPKAETRSSPSAENPRAPTRSQPSMRTGGSDRAGETELVINFNPRDPLSHLNLRAQLMAANGKFAHLKTLQSSKKK